MKNHKTIEDALREPDFVYTFGQAVEDGTFINLSELYPHAVEGWFKFPVYCTDTVMKIFDDLVLKRPWTKQSGYTRDMIIAARFNQKEEITPQMISFTFDLGDREIELWSELTQSENGQMVVMFLDPSDY